MAPAHSKNARLAQVESVASEPRRSAPSPNPLPQQRLGERAVRFAQEAKQLAVGVQRLVLFTFDARLPRELTQVLAIGIGKLGQQGVERLITQPSPPTAVGGEGC